MFQCDRTAARALSRVFIAQSFPTRTVIAHQGEASHRFWLVIEGSVRVEAFGVEGQRQQLARHGPGEVFGAWPSATTHRADYTANPGSVLLCADATHFSELVATDVQVAGGMARLLARQLDRAMDRMVMRTTFTAAGRVYAELLALADGKDRIAPPPQVTALALSANTTRETASRAIAALIRRGIVSRDDEAFVIHAPRMLQEMVF